MLFRSRLRTGRRREVSFGGRGTPAMIVLAIVLVLTSGTSVSLAVRDTAAIALRAATEPIAAVGRGLAAVGALGADIQALRTRLALTLQERDEAAASAARVASLEREITELQAILDLRTSISFISIAVQVVARDFEIGKRLEIGRAHV